MMASTDSRNADARPKLRLDGDADELRLNLGPDGIHWIISGAQVGARWTHSDSHNDERCRYLGGPSPLNCKDSPLRLWIGALDATQELLVMLTMSVKLASSSHSRPRRMFLVVPAESLSLESCAPAFQKLALDQVPEALFERPSDARSANSNAYLHLSCALESPKHRSSVIMPARQYEGQVRGTALSLLDSFKSLAHSARFDLYLQFNTYAQLGLVSLEEKLRNTTYATPGFDLQGMYRGHRHGGVNLWAEQGWHCGSPTQRRSKRKASQEPQPPPRYLAPSAQPTAAATEPPPVYSASNRPDRARSDPVSTRERQPLPATAHGASLEPTRENAVVPASSPPVAVLVPRSSTPEELDVGLVSELARETTHPEPRSETSGIRETPSPRRATASKDATLTAPSMTISSLPSLRFFDEVPNWLTTVWRYDPLVHYKFCFLLFRLGASAKRDDAELYQKTRVRGTNHLVVLQASQLEPDNDTAPQPKAPFPVTGSGVTRPGALLHETSDLIAWMTIVNTSCDTAMFESLVMFERQRKHVLDLWQMDTNGEYFLPDTDVMQEVMHRHLRLMESKASIVCEVCFDHGYTALRAQRDIMPKMIQALDAQKNAQIDIYNE